MRYCLLWLVVLLFGACAAPYQLTYQRDLPELKGSLNDTLQSESSDRLQVLEAALRDYGLSLDYDLMTCNPKIEVSAYDTSCVQIKKGADPVPLAVAAIISVSVDQCLYETYQENTSAVSQKTLGTFLGLGLLAGGIVNSIANGPSGIATATAVGGAGVTAASNLSNEAPTPAQGSAQNIIEAGMNYYPILTARQKAYNLYPKRVVNQTRRAQNVRLLSSLWDAAGSACTPGVLKGRSWFNRIAEKRHP